MANSRIAAGFAIQLIVVGEAFWNIGWGYKLWIAAIVAGSMLLAIVFGQMLKWLVDLWFEQAQRGDTNGAR